MLRRSFLSLLGSSALLPYMANAANSNQEKACIFVYLHGGIAMPETFNPIPEANDKFRSTTGYQKGKNFLLGGSFSKLAQVTDKFSLVHSLSHRDGNHQSASAWILSGKPTLGLGESTKSKEPAVGSLICQHVGPRNIIGIPSLVKVNKIEFGGVRRDDSAWLGAKCVGFDADREGIDNLKFGIPKSRVDQRMALVEMIDRKENYLEREWASLRREAYNIAVGQAADSFDITRESRENQIKFGIDKSEFGRSALMAVRLIRSGSRFVQISNGGWDNHMDIKQAFDSKGPELDLVLFSLITQLELEGLLEKTLIVITTEFGRTKINSNNGRDHNNRCIPLVFAGGGYDHGRIIGRSENDSLSVKDNPFDPEDLLWTVCNHFDIPKYKTVIDNESRPRHLFKDDAKNILI